MALTAAVHRPDVGVEGSMLVEPPSPVAFCPDTGVGGKIHVVGTVCKLLHVTGSFCSTVTGPVSVRVSERLSGVVWLFAAWGPKKMAEGGVTGRLALEFGLLAADSAGTCGKFLPVTSPMRARQSSACCRMTLSQALSLGLV